MSAITHDDDSHGVGLQSFEDESGNCVAHNSFVKKNYNGMEMAAKVGGYVAPTCAVLAVLCIALECCSKDGCWGGKCIPSLLILGALICQGLTFLLFQSDLFCDNKDIANCEMGDAGYRSMQACFVYAFCFVLYYCGPTPIPPFSPPGVAQSSSRGKKGGSKKKVKPGKNEDWTKEMYKERRKEKKDKSRGVSGRNKHEILDDLNGDGEKHETALALYESDDRYDDRRRRGGSSRGGGSREQLHYDDYVDTEPDGMDWSAYSPEQREEYYER